MPASAALDKPYQALGREAHATLRQQQLGLVAWNGVASVYTHLQFTLPGTRSLAENVKDERGPVSNSNLQSHIKCMHSSESLLFPCLLLAASPYAATNIHSAHLKMGTRTHTTASCISVAVSQMAVVCWCQNLCTPPVTCFLATHLPAPLTLGEGLLQVAQLPR